MELKATAKNLKHKMMGVINITPNSFSDGDKFNSPDSFENKIAELKKWNVTIFDVGAESTAPFNDAVSLDEEIERFKTILFPKLDSIPKNSVLSVDTYKTEVFTCVYNEVTKRRPDLEIWWNDVSGVLDDALFETLKECPKAKYVFCQTLTEERAKASDHMDHLAPEVDITLLVLGRLKKCVSDFEDRELKDRLILDPCFGFSKTLDQNYTLIKELPELMYVFDSKIPWLIGLSRKSFFKKAINSGTTDSSEVAIAEMMQSIVVNRLMVALPDRELIFRMHDPAVFFASAFVAETI